VTSVIDEQRRATRATESWFVARGLPFFVEGRTIDRNDLVHGRSLAVLVAAYFGSLFLAVPGNQPWTTRLASAAVGVALLVAGWALANLARHRRALERPRRVGLVEVVVYVLGPAGVVLALRRDTDMALGAVLADATVLGVVAAFEILDVAPIARWALRRTFAELGTLFPLVTRALPMLLLFTTFLFINTEVWMVASSLSPPVLWLAVAFFAVLAVGFLLVRLPEEVARVSDELSPERVQRALQATPLEHVHVDLSDVRGVTLTRRQQHNLLLVLLVTQISQVLVLAMSVWAFFLVFGRVAIEADVIAAWLGRAPSYPPPLGALGFSRELLQVSVFLAAFSGLYFTVYAVTDANYREQFFTKITDELEQAVGVRAAYLALCRASSGTGRPGC
jgi:hypothetical protein